MAVALFSKDVEVHASAVMVVLDTYPRMIIEIIGNQWPPKQVFKLTQNEKDQSFMRKITQLQRQMISKLDTSGYINLDVSCIYKLIRHFNLLPVPKQGWGNKPSIHDTKEGDDVERMKIYRNDILHRPQGGLSEQEGKHFFQESYEMAKRLDIRIGSPMNGFESKIKAIQCFSVGRQKYVEALEKCAEYQAQLQETRDTPSVDLYYGNDIMMKLGSSDNQNAIGDSQCSIYIRDQSLDVNAVIQKLDYIKEILEKGPYNVIKLDGAESGSLILHITIPNRFFVTKETLHDSLQSFLHEFFLTAGFQCKTGLSIVLAESDRYSTDDNVQDFDYLLEDPLPILKLDVNVQNSAFQNENVLYEEVNKFVTGMYDAIDINGVPVNGSKREVMMFTGPENDIKVQSKEPDMDDKSRHHWQKVEHTCIYKMDTCQSGDQQQRNDLEVLEIFNSLIAQTVKSGELICSRRIKRILGEDIVDDLRARKDSNESKVNFILESILHSDDSDKWDSLNEALTNVDFVFVPKIYLKEYNPEVIPRLRKLVQALNNEDVEPEKLSKVLKDNEVLLEVDVQNIGTECYNRGNKAGLIVLIDRVINSSSSNWYQKLTRSLYEVGLERAAQDLESDSSKKRMDAVDAADDISIDDHWRKLIVKLFRKQIVQKVTPSDLLGNIGTLLSPEEKREIRNIEDESPHRAMEKVLDLLDNKEIPGKWQAFKRALVDAGLIWLNEFIEGNFTVCAEAEQWENMINLFECKLSKKIKPREIIQWLYQEELINDIDKQAILQIDTQRGEILAAYRLLSCLSKRQPNSWYPKFMAILYINNYEDLVFEVDSDMFKEIQKTYGHNPSDVRLRSSIPECTGVESKETEANANESDVKQNYVSVSENYRKSTNNLSCPKEKHEDSMDELQDSIMSSLMSFDENNLRSRDETSEKNVFSTESAKPQVVDKDMSLSSDPLEREPNSLLYERINRDLAIAVSETPEEIQHNILQMPYDDVESDLDSEDETIPQKVLNLREYQKELAERAKDGKNCLIVAPTGCGKTHVIMDIIQDHNSKMSRKGLIVKVAVLVEQQALAEQQAERCKEYLQPLRVKLITGEIHREEKLPKLLSSWLKRRDILVITSALLDNYLKSGDIKIEDFTLLVFDECHHAKDKHSYARLMHYYMDRKFDDNFPRERLPKVIGLTASVGVGKSNKIPGAKIHIKTTMANLDAEELVTVKKNRLELSEHVVVPEKGVIVAPARQKDHFGKTLVKLMESTEKHIFTTPYAKMFERNDSILKAPTEKGSDSYTQWISRLRRETAQIKEEARRYITTWRSYLNVYNEALIIYEDARVKDATNYLEEKMYDLNEGIIKNEIDDTMKRLYDITKPMFVACIDDKSYENPKLKELKSVIFKMLREKRDSRIIVFIKTRDLADAMVNWMRETDGLDRLKPHKFVGAQAAGAKGGMTKKDQTEILKLFKDGNRQIVCATSVAEEGLDIPTCNLVIRYDHVTNETAMIQSRGRGRAEGCQFIIIASEKRKTAEKEEINEIREEIMKEAIEEIQSDIKDNKVEFVEELEEIQRLAKKKRDKDALSEKGSSDNKELELRCEKCNQYICMSTDIKKIQDAHHAVVNDEIRKNITVIKCNSKWIDNQISVNAGKVKCINCGSGLGQIIKYREAQFPVLKIEHFYVTDTTGKNSYYKKWKSVPFKPTALSEDDLESRLQGPRYVDI